MKQYEIILLDADGTLFDFDTAERKALAEVFHWANLPLTDSVSQSYHEINDGLWKQLERHEITRPQLLFLRFDRLLRRWNFPGDGAVFNERYLDFLSTHGDLIPHAEEVCRSLAGRYRLYLLTNGVTRVQVGRMEHSPIRECFTDTFTSEAMGADKPSLDYFSACFERMGNPPRDCMLMVGDSLTADMAGAAAARVDTCWYNPKNATPPHTLRLNYIIRDLRELLRL